MLKDSQQRLQATDPRGSFIVQAPAGSGKTEILTQRYLRLLATVKAPEQIVALTFTRKAASEMRERIVLALQNAASGATANSAHQQQTYSYATDALTRSKQQGWQLLDQPGRLRIITIDSLCQTLSHAIPLLDKQIPFAQISDDPHAHYRTAARACLAHALDDENLHQPLKELLTHLDNRQDKLLNLLSDLLATREQWLPFLYCAREQGKASYEQMLALIEQHELSRLQQSIPLDCQGELCSLARQVAGIEGNTESPRYFLANWYNFNQINREIAQGLASLLLTSDDKLRKSFDHHVGLKRGVCADFLYDKIKLASKELLLQLEGHADFLAALLKVKHLPSPHYDHEQWQVLQALFVLLPLLVGHLHLVFTEHNEVDFSAISQQALDALGDDDQPTDLALYLDNAIHHVLIDEFQDTSMQQFQLLTKLVQGWQPEDGKTLFVVGDPMQSIYRFRQAEVGLFLKAKRMGIGPVRLTSLELCCNFRSTATVVNWVNQQFKTIFPQDDDIESGAISFHPSVHVKEASDTSSIRAWQFPNRRFQAEALAQCVAEELATNPTDQIAILVRSRSQLTEIVNVLRERQIPFQGVEIELLAKLPHLQDLWSLTQALLLPANRLAWLALLRSPFCGLSLVDLHCIANFAKNKPPSPMGQTSAKNSAVTTPLPPCGHPLPVSGARGEMKEVLGESIYYALGQEECTAQLSEDGQLRVQFVYAVLRDALACRHQNSLVDWIAQTLSHLHADKIFTENQQEDIEQFLLLLERFTRAGQLPDLQQFSSEFAKLYSLRANPARLQVMTIHKAKGLEFDCVILPSLSTKSQANEQPLLRWLKLPSQQHDDLFLVSPIKAAHEEQCLLYDYLGKLAAEKDHYELQRLLYVAATRAKKRLCLFDSSEKETKGTLRSLLQHQAFLPQKEENKSDEYIQFLPILYRLPGDFYRSPPANPHLAVKKSILAPSQRTSLIFPSPRKRGEGARRAGEGLVVRSSFQMFTPKGLGCSSIARQLGIIAHELLEWICNHHPNNIADLPWAMVANQCKSLGFTAAEQMEVDTTLRQQLTRFFNQPIGQWLSKAHSNERNEYELLINDQGSASTRIIDRTFIADGIRWIIDFKTGSEDEGAQSDHRQQVNNYAQLLAINSLEPIHCGIYYLTTGNWVQWDYCDNE